MELVNRYVHQVGRRLPRRLRDDVKAAIPGLAISAGQPPTLGRKLLCRSHFYALFSKFQGKSPTNAPNRELLM